MFKKVQKFYKIHGIFNLLLKIIKVLYSKQRTIFLRFLLFLRFNIYKLKYDISVNWFLNSELRIYAKNFINNKAKNSILEIGSYEGMSAIFFANNFLDNNESELTIVDPHYVNMEVIKRFHKNIKKAKNFDRISYYNIESDEYFNKNLKQFNFIYIDGDHSFDQVFKDLENCSQNLQEGGVIWLDDYLWYPEDENLNPILKFMSLYGKNYEVIHKGYQFAIRKLPFET